MVLSVLSKPGSSDRIVDSDPIIKLKSIYNIIKVLKKIKMSIKTKQKRTKNDAKMQ